MKELDTIREALKPCPFCGGKAHIYNSVGGIWLYACGQCKAETRASSSKSDAFEIWNQRALSTIDPDTETGWMIEKHNPIPMWWNGCPKREGNGAWSSEPNDGIRFSRKVDAELCAIAQGFSLSKVQITDHRWG